MAGFSGTYDYETEQADIARRQKIADAMQAGSLAPMQLPTQPGVKSSWMEVLAKVMQGYTGAKAQESLKQDQKTLTARYDAGLQSGISDVLAKMQPRQVPDPGNGGTTGHPPGEIPLTGYKEVPADPKEAIMAALGANHPVLRELGMTLVKGQIAKKLEAGKPDVKLSDLLSHGDSTTVTRIGQTIMPGFQAKPVTKSLSPGEVPYNPETNTAIPVSAPVLPIVKLPGTDGQLDMYEISPGGQHRKVDPSPKVTVNANPTMTTVAEKEFSKKLGSDRAASVDAVFKDQQNAEKMLPILQKLEDLDKAGTFNGPQANLATTLSAFASTIGVSVDADKLANSQTYQATLAKQIATYLTAGAGVGRSLTDADRKKLEEQFPQLISTSQGRQQIIGMLRREADFSIRYGNTVRKQITDEFPDLGPLMRIEPSSKPYPGSGQRKPPVITNWK